MNSRFLPLGELCKVDRQGIHPEEPEFVQLPFIGLEHVGAGTGFINLASNSRTGDQKSAMFRFDKRHVLYGKLRPYLNKVATPNFSGKCSTELIPLLPREGVDRSFLAYVLRHKNTVDFVMSSVSGSRMPRTDMNVLLSMPVPIPQLSEQCRIANILNTSAKLQQLKAHARERFIEISSSLFVKMFGNPVENSMKWDTVPFFDAVQDSTSGNPKVKKKDYLPIGPIPIVDQAQEFISGYTTENNLYVGMLPVVVFGDHTRTFKYVDFEFALGADGVKVLVPQNGFEAAFLMSFFANSPIPHAGYSRHFKFLQSLSVFKPPLAEQRQFSTVVETARSLTSLDNLFNEKAEELTTSLMSQLGLSAF